MYIELSTVCTIYSYWIMNRIQCRENLKIWNDRIVWKPSTVFEKNMGQMVIICKSFLRS